METLFAFGTCISILAIVFVGHARSDDYLRYRDFNPVSDGISGESLS